MYPCCTCIGLLILGSTLCCGRLQIKHPELPRANKAVSTEKPEGGNTASNRSVLQQHVDFFDTDHDGKSGLDRCLKVKGIHVVFTL